MSFDVFLPTVKDAYTIDGHVYGFPFLGFNFGLYWNKDLFAEARLDPDAPPTTAEEVVEYARKLTKGDGAGNILQLGIPVDECSGPQLRPTPMPSSADHPEKYGASMLEYNPYFIPAGSSHPEEAWQLLKWLCTDPEAVTGFADFCANISHLVVYPEDYESELFDNPNFLPGSGSVALTSG